MWSSVVHYGAVQLNGGLCYVVWRSVVQYGTVLQGGMVGGAVWYTGMKCNAVHYVTGSGGQSSGDLRVN